MVVEDDQQTWRRHAAELIRFATTLVGPFDAQDLLSTAFLNATTSKDWPEW